MKEGEEFMICFALRYAIGRQSMAPSIVSDYIRSSWDEISGKSVLYRVLSEEVERLELLKGEIDFNPFGMGCDEKMWKDLLQWMGVNL